MATTRTATTGPITILTASRRGCIHHVTPNADGWEKAKVARERGQDIHSLVALPSLSAFLVGKRRSVDLVDLATLHIMRTFQTESMERRSLRHLYSSKRHVPNTSVGLAYFSIAYTASESKDCVVQTYVPPHEGAVLCSCPPSAPPNKACCPWSEALEKTSRVKSPGTWEALPSGCLIGIRRQPLQLARAQLARLAPAQRRCQAEGQCREVRAAVDHVSSR